MRERIEELIDNKKYKELKIELDRLNESDIAEFIEDINPKELAKVFRLINKDVAAEVFSFLPLTVETELLSYLKESEVVGLLDEMAADDATDLLGEMPANVVTRLLKKCNSDTREDINKLLRYSEDSAGSIMTVEFAELKEELSVEKAITILKREIEEYETVNTCFVVDKSRRLVGKIVLKDLLFADPKDLIKDIKEDVISVKTITDQEEVAAQFKKYDVTVMPVVDSENRLVGIITVDDIVDVMEEETTEDMEKMAAIIPTDKPYLNVSVFETWKKRIPWLLLLMVSATFTGKIISNFENALAACTVLTAFIPMLMDTGGNAGGQASVTIIRGLSLNEIELKDLLKIVWKEIRVAVLCGVTLALANFAKMLLIDGVSIKIAGVVCFTLVITVILAKVIGSTLPLLAKKLKFDPAVMASPFITTIVDALSLLVYFGIASKLLGI